MNYNIGFFLENVTIAHLPDSDEYNLERQYANVTGFGRYLDNSKLQIAINLNNS